MLIDVLKNKGCNNIIHPATTTAITTCYHMLISHWVASGGCCKASNDATMMLQ
jgi:hypothetical protein